MQGLAQARQITTTQCAVHEKLLPLVHRYKNSEFQRPIQAHTQQVFEQARTWLQGWRGEVILDSCCGVGQSTALLAQQYPDAKIIGLDKSAFRVEKHHAYQSSACNYTVLRADVNDFWRLAQQHEWTFKKHFIMYPNPYPKPAHLQKRWYANAIMPTLMALSDSLEVRSNWRLYLEEFALAAQIYNFTASIEPLQVDAPITPFEKKYTDSKQACFALYLERK